MPPKLSISSLPYLIGNIRQFVGKRRMNDVFIYPNCKKLIALCISRMPSIPTTKIQKLTKAFGRVKVTKIGKIIKFAKLQPDYETELCDLMEECLSPGKDTNASSQSCKKGMYQYLVDEIRRAATQSGTQLNANTMQCDGRIDSALKEIPFLREMSANLLQTNPTWDIQISPPRASYDIMINGLQINLKLTDCKTSDNSANKRAIYYSITGHSDYPYSSTWNDFAEKLAEAKATNRIKTARDPMTEYHYLVKNKQTGEVLFKSIFDIHTYISNPSNDLQINWRNEFANAAYHTDDAQYYNKVAELLACVQKSVQAMIRRNSAFAEANIGELI